MAKWWELTFQGGDPTDDDRARVAELVPQGFTSGQLVNAADYAGWVITEKESGPADVVHDGQPFPYDSLTISWGPGQVVTGIWVNHAQVIGLVSITFPDGDEYAGELTADDYAGMAEPGSG